MFTLLTIIKQSAKLNTCRSLKNTTKRGKQAIGRSRGGLTTKIHMVTASERSAVSFSLSGGEKHDSPEGMKLLNFTPIGENAQFILMDWAYEGDAMRSIANSLGYESRCSTEEESS